METPQQIGRYEVRRQVGRGGMAVVLEAWDPVLHRALAVKLVDKTSLDASIAHDALRRFKRKVQQEDIIKDIKKHSFYLKPGDRRRAKQALARKRTRKKQRRESD